MLASADHRLRSALDLCGQAINTNLPVLILGETGAGKDTLARALHDRSQRSGAWLVLPTSNGGCGIGRYLGLTDRALCNRFSGLDSLLASVPERAK